HPVQVVYDVPLVQGKLTAFSVDIGMKKCTVDTQSPNTEVDLAFEGSSWTKTVRDTDFTPAGTNFKATLIFNPNPGIRPVGTGSEKVTATINAPGTNHIPEIDETNNTLPQNV